MNINLSTPAGLGSAYDMSPAAKPPSPIAGNDSTKDAENDAEVREKFNEFVGQAFFGQMMKAMRKTVGKPAYFHGGRAEEIFQEQLDQVIGEKLSKATGDTLSGPMFELFHLNQLPQR
ncbi:MAG TPA: rod-binding protein [Thermoguttaceae bacterium]|nr:rod-binding protein [Thermoguttaceae bacterium]